MDSETIEMSETQGVSEHAQKPSVFDKYKKAGKIAADVLAYGKELIKKDAKVLDVCNKIEQKIFSLGAKPAFPAQISMNEIAAHFCPEDKDEAKFQDQVVSLDVGVHIGGCIGDTACTVDLSGNNKELVKSSEEALKAAIETVKVGVKLSEIGKAIEDAITSYGFQPVRNLSGHGLDSYDIHSSPTIPNFNTKENVVLDKQVIAIEPFATDGQGMIEERKESSIYNIGQVKNMRDASARELLQCILEEYHTLPFAKRWLLKKFPAVKVEFGLRMLQRDGVLHHYKQLWEKGDGLVSQAEHTVLVGEPCVVTTRV